MKHLNFQEYYEQKLVDGYFEQLAEAWYDRFLKKQEPTGVPADAPPGLAPGVMRDGPNGPEMTPEPADDDISYSNAADTEDAYKKRRKMSLKKRMANLTPKQREIAIRMRAAGIDIWDIWSYLEEKRRKERRDGAGRPAHPLDAQEPGEYRLPGEVRMEELPYDQQVKMRSLQWDAMQRAKAEPQIPPEELEPLPNTGMTRKQKMEAAKVVMDYVTKLIHDPKQKTLTDDQILQTLEDAPELAEVRKRFRGIADKVVSAKTLKGYITKARRSFQPQLGLLGQKRQPGAAGQQHWR